MLLLGDHLTLAEDGQVVGNPPNLQAGERTARVNEPGMVRHTNNQGKTPQGEGSEKGEGGEQESRGTTFHVPSAYDRVRVGVALRRKQAVLALGLWERRQSKKKEGAGAGVNVRPHNTV